MKYIDLLVQNQNLIIAVLAAGSYLLKSLIDRRAGKSDIFKRIKPGSDALYEIVHAGIELLAKQKGLKSAEKLIAYKHQIENFEATWKNSKTKAVEELAAWYLSMKEKIKMKAKDIRDAIVDALEQVGDRQDYYILNSTSREQRETLDGMIKSWLSSIGIKSEG